MPRKNPKSQAAKLRWQKQRESHDAETSVQAENPGPQISKCETFSGPSVQQRGQQSPASKVSYAEVVKGKRPSDASCVEENANVVKPSGQRDSSPAPKFSYANKVQCKSPSGSPCEAKCSRANQAKPSSQHGASGPTQGSYADGVMTEGQSDVSYVTAAPRANGANEVDEPTEISVPASYSQSHCKYGKYSNSQCTCNSLMFLAFLYENENITTADLDVILDKGNAMYTEARERFPNYSHLATDELPDVATARRDVYYVNMNHLSRYGTLGDPEPGCVDHFLDLVAGLSCLLSEVQYALLVMRGLCIAVFRTRSGRYGFFDPHDRQEEGLPISSTSPATGSAVMVTFTRLCDMIKRIKICHKKLETPLSCNYELKPVEFHSMNPAHHSEAIQITTHSPVVTTTVSDDAVHSEPCGSAVSDHCDDMLYDLCTVMEAEPQSPSQSSVTSLTAQDITSAVIQQHHIRLHDPSAEAAPHVSPDISKKLSKLPKNQRSKFMRKAKLLQKETQKKDKKMKQREKYASNETHREKKKMYENNKYCNELYRKVKLQHTANRYHHNAEIKQKYFKEYMKNRYISNREVKWQKRDYITKRYRNDATFKEKQKLHVTERYRNDATFKEKQKLHVTERYRNDATFKEKQKLHVTERYRNDATFKEKQKLHVTERYRNDATFKEKQKLHVTKRYRNDATFKERQKLHVTERYRNDATFKEKQKLHVTERYRSDASFKERQKLHVTERYRNDNGFKERQKLHVTERYRSDASFKERQKLHVTERYRNDNGFKERQKLHVTKRYRNDNGFKERQKLHVTERYRNDASFKEKQKLHVTERYRNDASFKERQKLYLTKRYRDDATFKEKQKLCYTKKYSENSQFREQRLFCIRRLYNNDQTYRQRHRELMKQRMRERYNNNLAYKTMHNMRCAMKIKRKYRRLNRQTEESDNSVIAEAISVFRLQIKAGPTYVCTVCHKASFPNQVKQCKRSNYVKNPHVVAACLTGKYVHVCDEVCRNQQQCTMPDERRKEWICHTCHDHLKRGAMPSLAVANNMELVDIPPELCDLNILERHLIAKCIPFAKIIPLPKGRQNLIRGNVVCVPSEVQETVEALPRVRSESQVLRVKLKRRLCYRGHQLFQTVTWTKLVHALHKLKQIHPQYKDVSIRDDAELCDPTLPDEDDDDDDEEEQDEMMNDDDYNEDDLMEIDRCENEALHELENEPDNELDDVDMLSCDAEQPTEQTGDDDEQEGDMPNGGFALESCLQPTDVSEEILSFSEGIYSVAPAERNSPVGFFKTPKLEAMAFPMQFPTGQNTLDEKRLIKLSPSGYFKARLFCIDARFARDTNYLFFAQFVTEIHLATNSMTIQLRKAKPMTRDGRKITSDMLLDKREVERLVRSKDAIRFMQPLRGTPAYWQKTTRNLFAMIRQLGTPTFFCTFSAAEMRWPEVIEAIKSQQGEGVNFDELDWSAKCDILRSNPVTAMRMFDKRVEALFRDLLLSPAQPLGKVIDYFYRVEFQHRGSPHIHCLLWVEGAPVFEEDSDQTVCDFVSRYITAQLPDPRKQPELHRKVKEVQMHSRNHSRTCFRSLGSGCRFGFPKPPCKETMITRPVESDTDISQAVEQAKNKLIPLNLLLNEPEIADLSLEQLLARCNLTVSEYEECMSMIATSCTVTLRRDPKDCWVNGYNPYLLKAWDANIDVSYILNAYSCIMYLTSYITKQESKMSDYLKTVIENSTKEHVNECDEMREIMQAYSKKREISAQEAVARACGLKLKKCSRGVVFLSTDDNPVKMSRPMSALEDATPESSNIWMTSLTDKYKNRPETPEFEEMCLADFAATCRPVYGNQARGKDVLRLLNDMGFVQMRKTDKPAVIRFFRPSKEKCPEQHYGSLLKLYIPYRSDAELKRSYLPTYESFYQSGIAFLPGRDHGEPVKEVVKRNKDKYEKNSKEIEQAVEEYEQNRGVIDEWSNLAPESEVVRMECIEELEAAEPHDDNVQENVPDYSRQVNAVTEARAIREPPAMDPIVLRQMYQNLNQKQACVFYLIRDWCTKRVCRLNPEPLFIYINGGAGAGKSHLIKCIYSEASKILCKMPRHADEADISNPTVLLTAFTGTAAFNICGTTLHSLLKLPRSLKPPFQGLGNKLDEVRAELINAEILIIDEVSMVSKALFAYVDVRLKQIKGSQKPFGGMSVIAVGDFYQLPPVRQSKSLCVHDPADIDLWQEHFEMITLTEIMRQKDDVAFAEMLNRIRVKDKSEELSEADRALFSQAITEPDQCPTDALHIFATNKQVDAHNTATLNKFHSHVTKIDADDYKKDPTSGKMTRQEKPFKGGKNELADTLQVAEGARVMLTRNLDVSQGLVNGSFATLVKVVTSEPHGSAHVNMLGLKMDDDTAGRNNNRQPGSADNLVYIERSEEQLKQKGAVRRQFPIKLAFACTIHKVQGMTRQSAVVSLKHIFEPGMAYVAVSRVTSLGGLHLLDMDESKIYANTEITEALQAMRQVNLDHMMPLLKLRETLSQPDTLTIVHHNTEGLPAHINDIKSHHELCLADVLCLTETHLQGSFVADSLHLQGYNMFRRNRHLSYTNVPQMANRGGGGVAVYVRDYIQVREKQYVHSVTDLEFVALKIEAPVRALIAAVYRPPDYSVRSFLSNLSSLVDSLEIMDVQPIIVCGDLNENLLSGGNKPILEMFRSRGYEQLITDPTTDKNTLLDMVFISRPQQCLHSGVLKTYHSYHSPVYCVLSFDSS